MDYTYTKIWRIEHKLVVAKTIEDAIALYRNWANKHKGIAPENIINIKAIGDNQIPENFDALIEI